MFAVVTLTNGEVTSFIPQDGKLSIYNAEETVLIVCDANPTRFPEGEIRSIMLYSMEWVELLDGADLRDYPGLE